MWVSGAHVWDEVEETFTAGGHLHLRTSLPGIPEVFSHEEWLNVRRRAKVSAG